MSKNYYEDGHTMDWHNTTGAMVLSGQAVGVGNITGVAHADIPDGSHGVLHMTGVFILPKVGGETWPRGARLYLNADGRLTAEMAEVGAIVAGTAWITSGAGEEDSRVRLGY
ncbi:hypothetical protein CWR41_22565 [Cedecea lapagei]|nr:hypothetical protein CWR41_22565 [Cedecea lapagei]